MTYQETTDRINALAYALGTLNEAQAPMLGSNKITTNVQLAREDIALELSRLATPQSKSVEKEKTNQNLRDKDLVAGAFVYNVNISEDGSNQKFKTIVMIGAPSILDDFLFCPIDSSNKHEIKDKRFLSVDIISVNYDFYKKLTPEAREFVDLRIQASGNDIPNKN